MKLEDVQAQIRAVINDPILHYQQKKSCLAALAESLLDYPALSQAATSAMHCGTICDLNEGAALYRPRYVLPDYQAALRGGSDFLEMAPPQDLDEALHFLLIMYHHIPSITGFPVYLGNVDQLLEPFVDGVSDTALQGKLRRFWLAVDRFFPDSFVHANLGPYDSRVGRALLHIDQELRYPVPNLSLKVDESLTSAELLMAAVRCTLSSGKPYFINHRMMVADLGEEYGIASCYNSLKIGGGAHTLVRLNLRQVLGDTKASTKTFLDELLPQYVELTSEVIAARSKYLVEQSAFFDSNFLVREGWIDRERFTAMFGVFGLAETVNQLQGQAGRYGHSAAANHLSCRIIARLAQLVAARPQAYCSGSNGRALLHAQSGIDSDEQVSPGCRIPIGDEPDLYDHIKAVASHHKYFKAGISDIFHLEKSALLNPEAVRDIIVGAFGLGIRTLTFNMADGPLLRISGYLARRADLAAYPKHGSRQHSTVIAYNTVNRSNIFDRKVRIIDDAKSRWMDK